MSRLKEENNESYNLTNYFGFDEDDVDFSAWEKSSILNETNKPIQFQTNKPYRLALYVRPTEPKRCQRVRALTKSTVLESGSKNKTLSTVKGKEKTKEPKKTSRSCKKVMLFDENVRPDAVTKNVKKTPEKIDKSLTAEVPSTRKNILKEINTKTLTKTKQSKVRRSYERKAKEKDESENVEVEVEVPSEQIIQELEMKKLSRTKQKKTAKEELEFEKWANNMNSAFDDVEKFELSIAYD